jgi:N-hydroxyarylamine O-acetyltransferase
VSTTAATVRDAYLARLGVDPEPPSVDALFALHRAHVERVSYETLWIQVGERWSVDLDESVTRVATRRRGGYCFHLNGALSELLGALGYDVVRHVGGVHGPDGPSEDALSNHLVLTVRDLPNDANPEGVWYVDAGLGDALYEPLPLRAGTYQQGPFRFVLERVQDGIGDWHLVHDPQGAFAGMSWSSAPAGMPAFAARHEFLSTSPESGFVRFLVAQRRDATGADCLRGLSLERLGAGAGESTITTRAELTDVLGDLFDLDVAAIDPVALDTMWRRVHRAHEEWEAAGRP